MSATAPPDTGLDPWRDVVGQRGAVRRLAAAVDAPVHAYLLVGPPGSGKQSVARAFAAALLSVGSADDAARERHIRLALAGQHPDLRLVEPEGNTFRKSDAERVVRNATLAVEMNQQPAAGYNPEAPICASGQPTDLFFDGLESGSSNWTFGALTGGQHSERPRAGPLPGQEGRSAPGPGAAAVRPTRSMPLLTFAGT